MEKSLKFEYDEIGDILYIRKVAPYAEQETEPLEYNVYARLNPRTREVESVEILFFTKSILKDTPMRNLAELFSTPMAA